MSEQNPDDTVVIKPDSGDTIITTPTIGGERNSVVSAITATETTSRPSTTAATKYEVLGELGKGGVGQVLRVMDRDLRREVAMKMLLPEMLQGSDAETQNAVIRFVEEAQATGQLEHPNIVPVHDLGIDGDGRVYFTLKFVQGSSLKQIIRARNENKAQDYSSLRFLEVLISICQAVAYAHSKGIIHRDLKPDNVMLGKFGEVLVMDWGLAKVVGKPVTTEGDTIRVSTSRVEDGSQATMEGSVAGTPAYMSPEQAEGRISELDERTDIYSLGAILYEILTGEAPYRGTSALDVVKQVVAGPPTPVRKRKGAAGFAPIPRELAGICERAMERKPDKRYRSARAMRDDLQAYLENLPVSAAPDTTLQQLGKWVRRNRRQVQSGVVSATVVLALVAGGWFGWREYRLNQWIGEGQSLLNQAREQYKYKAPTAATMTTDAYTDQMNRAMWASRVAIFRNNLQAAMSPMQKAIDLAPNRREARALMADANMELWRLAIREDNTELANVTRREVEAFAPDLSSYLGELNGFGSVVANFDATDAEAFLFSFEMLNVEKDGALQPQRRIPVPYNLAAHRPDSGFLAAERTRVAEGKPVPVDRHSIFNLEPTATSKVGSGAKIVIPELPPGNYMLLVRAPGRVDTRVSLRMERLGRVNQSYLLPKTEDNPPGFFYMAGGDAVIGGDTAGAPARHTMKIEPAWIYHDEISMGEYGAFLEALVKANKAAEARQRLPKDFGKNLATLDKAGKLLPADAGVDPVAFAKSPVRGVSLNDAKAYVDWRGQQEGLPYRLPKDWEWEAACRGADGRKYSWGDTPGKGLAVVTQGYGDAGNNMSWKWEDYKDESPWGIHNLAGGAAEWTMSAYDANAKLEDPVYGQFAIRGNAWALPPVGLECAFRTSGQPDYFHPTIGFRMALDHPYTRTGPAQAVEGHVHGN